MRLWGEESENAFFKKNIKVLPMPRRHLGSTFQNMHAHKTSFLSIDSRQKVTLFDDLSFRSSSVSVTEIRQIGMCRISLFWNTKLQSNHVMSELYIIFWNYSTLSSEIRYSNRIWFESHRKAITWSTQIHKNPPFLVTNRCSKKMSCGHACFQKLVLSVSWTVAKVLYFLKKRICRFFTS